MSESPRQAIPPLAIANWQREQLPRWRALPAAPPVTDQVTALAYCFWPPERMPESFYTIEAAFRATWEQCGRLRSKLVASHRFPELEAFCEREGVALDLAPELSGRLAAMSRDCIHNLHRRFETPYVLIIQNDGFPLQPGLETFVGPYDYIGAPWSTPTWHTGLLFPPPAYTVGNGGFSLRSKRICELAAHAARHGLRWVPDSWFTTEDVFYCRVLPRGLRRCRRTAALRAAGRRGPLQPRGERRLSTARRPNLRLPRCARLPAQHAVPIRVAWAELRLPGVKNTPFSLYVGGSGSVPTVFRRFFHC